MSKILVLGSLSTDFVATTDIRPDMGETVQGNTFFTTFGGKGANQAVAASRLGADVVMLGKVGGDYLGQNILENMKAHNIDISSVEVVEDTSSGAAVITIYNSDNSIIYVPGANGLVDAEYVRSHKDAILGCDIAVAQHEVSEEAVCELVKICHENNIKVIINPAPFRSIPEEIVELVDYLIPNESECRLLFPDYSLDQALEKYPNKLIITVGSKGVMFNDGEKNILVPSFKVDVVDTTGAGDTFVGGFSVGVSNGLSLEDAISFGNLSAGQSVTKMGAQGGMPKIEDLRKNENYNSEWSL